MKFIYSVIISTALVFGFNNYAKADPTVGKMLKTMGEIIEKGSKDDSSGGKKGGKGGKKR